MKPENDGERIIALETNMTNIAKDISDIKADIKGIVMQLNQQISKQPTLEAEIIALKNEILEIKKSNSTTKTWIKHSLSGVLGAVLTFLIIQYLQNLK